MQSYRKPIALAIEGIDGIGKQSVSINLTKSLATNQQNLPKHWQGKIGAITLPCYIGAGRIVKLMNRQPAEFFHRFSPHQQAMFRLATLSLDRALILSDLLDIGASVYVMDRSHLSQAVNIGFLLHIGTISQNEVNKYLSIALQLDSVYTQSFITKPILLHTPNSQEHDPSFDRETSQDNIEKTNPWVSVSQVYNMLLPEAIRVFTKDEQDRFLPHQHILNNIATQLFPTKASLRIPSEREFKQSEDKVDILSPQDTLPDDNKEVNGFVKSIDREWTKAFLDNSNGNKSKEAQESIEKECFKIYKRNIDRLDLGKKSLDGISNIFTELEAQSVSLETYREFILELAGNEVTNFIFSHA